MPTWVRISLWVLGYWFFLTGMSCVLFDMVAYDKAMDPSGMAAIGLLLCIMAKQHQQSSPQREE